jgi:hypothetical protein
MYTPSTTPATCLVVKCCQHQLKSEVTSEQSAGKQVLQRYHDTDCYFHLWHIYRQSVGNKVVASVCTSAPFPSRGKHRPATGVCQIHQPWECGSKMQAISYSLTSHERLCSTEFAMPPVTSVYKVNVTVILETSYEWKERQCKYNVTLRRVRNEKSITYSECVFVAGIQHAYLPGCTIFLPQCYKRHDFRKRYVT